jgi:nucleoside-diphosphate-sugar epimerase
MDQNARSLVGIDNLVDLILTTVDHPAAANHAFLVSDDHDLSTLALVRLIGQAGGLPVRTVKVPIGLLQVLATLLGKSSYIERLVESLQVDIAQTKRLLGWSAPVSVKQAMTRLFEKSPPRHD